MADDCFLRLKNIIPHTNTPATAMKAKILKLIRFRVGQFDHSKKF